MMNFMSYKYSLTKQYIHMVFGQLMNKTSTSSKSYSIYRLNIFKKLVYCIDNRQEIEYNINIAMIERRIDYAEYKYYYQNR